ncbi:transposase [Legionella longbeachae]|nr:transposase [Legionella longbeachae]
MISAPGFGDEPKSHNGITEGFHRKMKLIQRRAYGFRNFENYRLRVKVLCS